MNGQGNLSTLEARVNTLERLFDELAEVTKQNSGVATRLEKAIAMMQQSHEDFVRRFEREYDRYQKETVSKVNELWDGKSSLRGGWIAISCLGGMIVGGASVGAVILKITGHL